MGADRPRDESIDRSYRHLPPSVPLEDTVTSLDADAVPDPHAGRNVAQDDALRD